MNTDEIKLINDTIEKFTSNPENFVLFRGETTENKGGLHFALDKGWAQNFGDTIIKLTLPAGSKIKLLKETDFREAYNLGFTSEQSCWDWIFLQGYDAIIGTEPMNSNKLDVIINPKYLKK